MPTQVGYNDAGVWRNIDRAHYNDAGVWRAALKTHYNDAGVWREVGRYTVWRGTVTIASVSTGGATTLVRRGYLSGVMGSKTDVFGIANLSIHTTVSNGAAPVPVTSYFNHGGAQHNSFASVRVSVDDGATWVTFTWGVDPNYGTTNYYYNGDAFGWTALNNGQVKNVLVQYV